MANFMSDFYAGQDGSAWNAAQNAWSNPPPPQPAVPDPVSMQPPPVQPVQPTRMFAAPGMQSGQAYPMGQAPQIAPQPQAQQPSMQQADVPAPNAVPMQGAPSFLSNLFGGFGGNRPPMGTPVAPGQPITSPSTMTPGGVPLATPQPGMTGPPQFATPASSILNSPAALILSGMTPAQVMELRSRAFQQQIEAQRFWIEQQKGLYDIGQQQRVQAAQRAQTELLTGKDEQTGAKVDPMDAALRWYNADHGSFRGFLEKNGSSMSGTDAQSTLDDTIARLGNVTNETDFNSQMAHLQREHSDHASFLADINYQNMGAALGILREMKAAGLQAKTAAERGATTATGYQLNPERKEDFTIPETGEHYSLSANENVTNPKNDYYLNTQAIKEGKVASSAYVEAPQRRDDYNKVYEPYSGVQKAYKTLSDMLNKPNMTSADISQAYLQFDSMLHDGRPGSPDEAQKLESGQPVLDVPQGYLTRLATGKNSTEQQRQNLKSVADDYFGNRTSQIQSFRDNQLYWAGSRGVDPKAILTDFDQLNKNQLGEYNKGVNYRKEILSKINPKYFPQDPDRSDAGPSAGGPPPPVPNPAATATGAPSSTDTAAAPTSTGDSGGNAQPAAAKTLVPATSVDVSHTAPTGTAPAPATASTPATYPDWMDQNSRTELAGVNSPLVSDLLEAARRSGVQFNVRQGMRSYDDARKNATAPGAPGVEQSQHRWGAAVDVNVKSGNAADYAKLAQAFKQVAAERGDTGFRWGGNFTKRDIVHFDMGLNYGQNNARNPYGGVLTAPRDGLPTDPGGTATAAADRPAPGATPVSGNLPPGTPQPAAWNPIAARMVQERINNGPPLTPQETAALGYTPVGRRNFFAQPPVPSASLAPPTAAPAAAPKKTAGTPANVPLPPPRPKTPDVGPGRGLGPEGRIIPPNQGPELVGQSTPAPGGPLAQPAQQPLSTGYPPAGWPPMPRQGTVPPHTPTPVPKMGPEGVPPPEPLPPTQSGAGQPPLDITPYAPPPARPTSMPLMPPRTPMPRPPIPPDQKAPLPPKRPADKALPTDMDEPTLPARSELTPGQQPRDPHLPDIDPRMVAMADTGTMSDAPVPGVTAHPDFGRPTMAFGSSITAGLGLPGVSKVGASPQVILDGIRQYTAHHSLDGQNVVLATGIENRMGVGNLPVVRQQIDALREAGAHVTVLGVGPGAGRTQGLGRFNAGIAQAVTDSNNGYSQGPGARFIDWANGPDRISVGKDGVHPDYMQLRNRVGSDHQEADVPVGQEVSGTPPPGTPEIPASTGGPVQTVNRNFDMTSNTGASPLYDQEVQAIESGGKNWIGVGGKPTGPSGLYAFGDQTWARFRGPDGAQYARAHDAPENIQKAAFDRFTEYNSQLLRKAGLPANDVTLYIMHQQGSGSGIKLLQAKDDEIAANVVGEANAKGNAPFFYDNAGGHQRALTVGEVKQRMAQKMQKGNLARPSSTTTPVNAPPPSQSPPGQTQTPQQQPQAPSTTSQPIQAPPAAPPVPGPQPTQPVTYVPPVAGPGSAAAAYGMTGPGAMPGMTGRPDQGYTPAAGSTGADQGQVPAGGPTGADMGRLPRAGVTGAPDEGLRMGSPPAAPDLGGLPTPRLRRAEDVDTSQLTGNVTPAQQAAAWRGLTPQQQTQVRQSKAPENTAHLNPTQATNLRRLRAAQKAVEGDAQPAQRTEPPPYGGPMSRTTPGQPPAAREYNRMGWPAPTSAAQPSAPAPAPSVQPSGPPGPVMQAPDTAVTPRAAPPAVPGNQGPERIGQTTPQPPAQDYNRMGWPPPQTAAPATPSTGDYLRGRDPLTGQPTPPAAPPEHMGPEGVPPAPPPGDWTHPPESVGPKLGILNKDTSKLDVPSPSFQDQRDFANSLTPEERKQIIELTPMAQSYGFTAPQIRKLDLMNRAIEADTPEEHAKAVALNQERMQVGTRAALSGALPGIVSPPSEAEQKKFPRGVPLAQKAGGLGGFVLGSEGITAGLEAAGLSGTVARAIGEYLIGSGQKAGENVVEANKEGKNPWVAGAGGALEGAKDVMLGRFAGQRLGEFFHWATGGDAGAAKRIVTSIEAKAGIPEGSFVQKLLDGDPDTIAAAKDHGFRDADALHRAAIAESTGIKGSEGQITGQNKATTPDLQKQQAGQVQEAVAKRQADQGPAPPAGTYDALAQAGQDFDKAQAVAAAKAAKGRKPPPSGVTPPVGPQANVMDDLFSGDPKKAIPASKAFNDASWLSDADKQGARRMWLDNELSDPKTGKQLSGQALQDAFYRLSNSGPRGMAKATDTVLGTGAAADFKNVADAMETIKPGAAPDPGKLAKLASWISGKGAHYLGWDAALRLASGDVPGALHAAGFGGAAYLSGKAAGRVLTPGPAGKAFDFEPFMASPGKQAAFERWKAAGAATAVSETPPTGGATAEWLQNYLASHRTVRGPGAPPQGERPP